MKTYIKHILIITVLSTAVSCGGLRANKKQEILKPVAVSGVIENERVQDGWRTSTVKNQQNVAYFSPIIEGTSIFVSNQAGKIQGFSTTSGEREFNIELKEPLASGVGVNVNTVTAVTKTGEVIAFDRNDASEKWRHPIGHIISAPSVLNDQAVVIRTIDGKLFGINAVTGEQLWGLERPVASLSVGLDAPVLIAGEGVVTGFSSGRLLANNVYSGQIFWEKRAFRPSGKNDIERLVDIDTKPVLAGESVIVGAYQGGVAAYRIRDGKELWRNPAVVSRKEMAAGERAIFIVQPQSDLAALDLKSGQLLWQQGKLHGHQLSAPVVIGNHLIVGTLSGELYFLDAETGEIESKKPLLMGAITALNAFEGGVVAYSSQSGMLVSISL